MKTISLITFVLLFGSSLLVAGEPIPASSVKWMGVLGLVSSPSTEKPVYMLIAPAAPVPSQHDKAIMLALGGQLRVAMLTWLRKHPKAVVEIVAPYDENPRAPSLKNIYVWIVEDGHNLNLELVREGLLSPESQTSVDPQKLEVPQADFDAFALEALKAGNEAKEKKLGMWKDAFNASPQ